MLFHRSKDKQDSAALDTPRHVEEETVRRWRDIAAARNNEDNKIVVGRFEDEMIHGQINTAATAEAPAWPETRRMGFELGESQVVEQEAPDESEYLASEQYSLGELSLDESVETVHIPPIQRRFVTQTETEPEHPTAEIIREEIPAPVRRTGISDSSLSVEDDLKQRFGSNIRSALGPGTVIEGTFRFDSPVCVEGTLSGEVYSSSALIVGAGASITGKITVGSLIILGDVEGSVEAEELVEIRATGSLQADIITKRIAIEDGGSFNGNCHLQED